VPTSAAVGPAAGPHLPCQHRRYLFAARRRRERRKFTLTVTHP